MYVLIAENECGANEFVDFWFARYFYESEDLYTENISKAAFSCDDLKSLFSWKNGMHLSGNKNNALESKVLRKLAKVNELKLDFSIGDFEEVFSSLSTIWKVFLLHCIQPDTYPIFDRHVYRAMQYIENGTIIEVSKSDAKKYRQYLDSYLDFFTRVLEQSNRDAIKVDRALWLFGKSIRQLKV